ncbi:hypothetical protein HETIRDRAFT_428664 [Heterobasidion irregulare TC 32-1]|uniref:Uncharacterized protein n=1 Tax=Heterobasidion irregulare (strain TC 32-1) TaxID=747525 RepID=W4K0N6_HETIT|nr:uncharacterized protein HETIRDRAFT_428664 [Heterobasidion irregulare TC 32-1]ETW78890.1 hypothetical protein HETIRDRAFT_428664 [Heterobasidion irregulare TC 32-1]
MFGRCSAQSRNRSGAIISYSPLLLKPPLAYHFGAHCEGLVFKITARNLRRSSRPTAEREERQTVIDSFNTQETSADRSLFGDADIVPDHLSHHHYLDLKSPPSLSPPPDSTFFLTPPSSPNRSLLSPISPILDLALLEQSPPSPIPSLHDSISPLIPRSPVFWTPTIRPTALERSFEPATPSPITLANNTFSPTFDFITMATPSMPARGDRTAPTFDPHQPRELRRYFADLDFHFGRSAIEDDQEKKKHACRFLDVNTCELWESLTTFTNATKTFKEFCKEVYRLCPGDTLEVALSAEHNTKTTSNAGGAGASI